MLRILTEPQEGATYAQLLAVAQEAERLGYDGFFRSDHLQMIGDHAPGPGSTEAWTTLAGLARETATIRLGVMVASATFRHPGILALTASTVDSMSGGRLEVGLGAGWFEVEHRSLGLPFPAVRERFVRLEEQLQILTGIWTTAPTETFCFTGTHFALKDCPALPQPAQRPHPPIIVGGTGTRRTPHLAARYAAEYNVPPFETIDTARECAARVRAACEADDRDPASMILSTAQPIAVGTNTADVRRRSAWLADTVEEASQIGLCGSTDQVVDKLGRLHDLGARRTYLQLIDIDDLDQLHLIAQDIMPQLPS